MFSNLKHLFRDTNFWMALIVVISYAAEAAVEPKLTVWRIITIAAMGALVISLVIRAYREHKDKSLPFLIVAGKPESQFRDTLGLVERALGSFNVNFKPLLKRHNLYESAWIYHREELLPPDSPTWLETILKIENKFWQLIEGIPGHKVYHIFINAPAALALGVGAKIGSRTEYVLYQYMPGTGSNPYHKVIDISSISLPGGSHSLKSRVSRYEHIRINGPEHIGKSAQNEVNVVISLSGHRPVGDAERRSKADGRPLVKIESNFDGTIPLRESWFRISREVTSAILNLSGDSQIKRLHIFLSMPVTIAFSVGGALGKFVRATIYHYFSETGDYKEVYRLEEL